MSIRKEGRKRNDGGRDVGMYEEKGGGKEEEEEEEETKPINREKKRRTKRL